MRSTVTPEAYNKLKKYAWPGNVRELENNVEKALIQQQVLRKSKTLTAENFVLPNDDISTTISSSEGKSRPLKLDEAITQHIRQVLELNNGKIHGPRGAASALGLNAYTLRSKMDKLGIPYKKRQVEI